MTALWSIFALIVSGTGVVYLAVTNAKRRRAFGQVAVAQRWRLLARIAVWLPGIAAILVQDWALFTLWAGGITVLGWVIAATSPHHLAALHRDWSVVSATAHHHFLDVSGQLAAGVSSITARVGDVPGPRIGRLFERSSEKRIMTLEARIATLEARLARLEGANPKPMPMPVARSSR
ncbi:MAG: hypothetical protein AAGA26_00705 [Pseudomonadota bacterium]